MSEPQSVIIDGRYISDAYPGIGRYVFNLVAALAELSEELKIILLVADGERQRRFDLADLESLGVQLVPLRSSLRSASGLLEGWLTVSHSAPALFHAPHILSPVPPGWSSVATIHDVIPTYAIARLSSSRDRLVYRALLRRALSSAAVLLTPSQAVSRELQQDWGVPPERVTVTPLAAGPAFRPRPAERGARTRRRLDLPERYVLCVGTNRPHKNLARLIEAWNGLPADRRAGCRLVIAGAMDPRFDSPWPSALADDGSVRLLGEVAEADLAEVYRGARLVVHPALCEGFGLPVIEAMACGVAVACSSARSLDEVCGEAAWRFDPTRVSEIGAAIERVLNDEPLAARLASDGLVRSRRLSWRHTAERTLAAYHAALDAVAIRCGA